MKADYVHKDSKTINDETVSYKITMPLINNEELQRIDNHYNELVDEFTKQYTKEKDMIVAQRIMMNLRKENKQLHIENQKQKEVIEKIDVDKMLQTKKWKRDKKIWIKINELIDEVNKLKKEKN